MNPTPTGALRITVVGRELVLERTFHAPIDDVWASVTEPERLDRWIGTWAGEAGVGRTVSFTMNAEEEAVAEDATIVECEPPRRLVVDLASPGDAPWRLSLDLAEADGLTTLTFAQVVTDGIDVGDVGPGWEFYLDRLVAARTGHPLPTFDPYLEAHRAYYSSL